ncbi:MFS general substrate transporter [Setomelanomma holmii]|uniref:MFS general substrate transporter n=1 Tax=Setomelanomma holmii TaxID=210430 RepID=A0A9P4LPF8_9PLEO|nr:MFS general substrate transporter [Setomelanomma holmii]
MKTLHTLNLSIVRKFVILTILIVYAVSGLCLVTALGALIGFFLDDYEKEGITQVQISGLLTYPSLFLGVGNIVFMPLAIAVGRRPVLLLSLLFLFISGILCATNQSLAWHLAARCVAAFSAAQCMALVLLIIQDVFFLHQRGRTFQLFSSFEVLLNFSLTIVSSYMSEALGWRSWYWLFTAIAGVYFVLAFIFVPDTDYPRPPSAERVLDTENFMPCTWRLDMRLAVVKSDFKKAIMTWKQMFEIWFFPMSSLVSPPYNWANATVSLIQIDQIIFAVLSVPMIGLSSDSFIQRKARLNRGIHEPV